MVDPFAPMTDRQARLRALFYGPAGSGKTTSALLVALGMAPEERICLIDSERGSAAKAGRDIGARVMHADAVAFAAAVRPDKGAPPIVENDPRVYTHAIRVAAARFDVVIIDGMTPAWDACMALVDLAAARVGNNSHKAWAAVTPLWRGLLDAILTADAHVIVTARAKVIWADERNDRGKMVPRAVGMQPVLRDGAEYEFDMVLRLESDHSATVVKARSSTFDGQTIATPGRDFGTAIKLWLDGADPDPAPVRPVPRPASAPPHAAPEQPGPAAAELAMRVSQALGGLGFDLNTASGAGMAGGWLTSLRPPRKLPQPGDAAGLADLAAFLATERAPDLARRWKLEQTAPGARYALAALLLAEGFPEPGALAAAVRKAGIGAPMDPADDVTASRWWAWWDREGRDKWAQHREALADG